jgi:hypothetical protein
MKHLNREKENMQLNNKANASQSYTLPSRSKNPPHDQNLSKSMPALTHGQTEKDKARAHNKVYKSLGDRWLN